MALTTKHSSYQTRLLVVSFILAAAGCVLRACRAEQAILQPEPQADALEAQHGPAVAVVNGVGFHTEVYCAFLWSLVQAKASVSAFVVTNRTSGIEEVIQSWYPAPFRGFADFLPAACNFSTIVFATFPDHHGHVVEQLLARACPGQQLILVIHNPEELLRTGNQRMLSLLETTDSHFLALAPHTVAALNDALQQLGWRRMAQLFVPVFPIDTGAPAAAPRQGFVLQGLLEAHRRNYTAIFDRIERTPALMESPGVVLTLIGHGNLHIPDALHGKVVKRASLAYQEYYRAMEGALAVLPAFASPAYLTHKASSSVAAAIICGTPLLADEALLRAYSYLPAHAVFETAAGEHDESAMAHVAAHSQEAEAKAQALAELREALYKDNQRIMADLLYLDPGRPTREITLK